MINQKLLKKAVFIIDNRIKSDEVFCLKELFEESKWTALSAQERQGFGKEFKKLVLSGEIDNVELFNTGKKTSQKYRKK